MSTKNVWLCFCFFAGVFSAKGQLMLSWDMLTDVKIGEEYSEELGYNYQTAEFGPAVNGLDGEDVSISGYIVPMDAMGTSYALSMNPNSSCFFCGGAGPETVVKLQLAPGSFKRYRTDDRLTFKGTLKMNKDNKYDFIYVLQQAELN